MSDPYGGGGAFGYSQDPRIRSRQMQQSLRARHTGHWEERSEWTGGQVGGTGEFNASSWARVDPAWAARHGGNGKKLRSVAASTVREGGPLRISAQRAKRVGYQATARGLRAFGNLTSLKSDREPAEEPAAEVEFGEQGQLFDPTPGNFEPLGKPDQGSLLTDDGAPRLFEPSYNAPAKPATPGQARNAKRSDGTLSGTPLQTVGNPWSSNPTR